MSGRSAFCTLGLAMALVVVACGNEDDSAPVGGAGSSGKGNAGSSGKDNSAGNSGKAGAGNDSGGADNAGGSAGTDGGAAGEGGMPPVLGCTPLSDFVHAVIKDDTNAKNSPRTVNGVVFCDDPADPAAYDDLF
jgi:hypothetical protein